MILEGEKVGEGLERRSGGAGSEGTIDLSAVGAGEVGRAVEGENFTGGIVEDDESAVLDILFAKTS